MIRRKMQRKKKLYIPTDVLKFLIEKKKISLEIIGIEC